MHGGGQQEPAERARGGQRWENSCRKASRPVGHLPALSTSGRASLLFLATWVFFPVRRSVAGRGTAKLAEGRGPAEQGTGRELALRAGPPTAGQREESSAWPSPRWWLGGGVTAGPPRVRAGLQPPAFPRCLGQAGFPGAFGAEPPERSRCRAGSSGPVTACETSRTTPPGRHAFLWVERSGCTTSSKSRLPRPRGVTAPPRAARGPQSTGMVPVTQLGKCRGLSSCGWSQLSRRARERWLAGIERRHSAGGCSRRGCPAGALPSVFRGGAGLAGDVPGPVPGR